MNLTFLGTCSGTEPMPGRRHVSFTVEHNGGLYWFDAGEGCSYTAHLLGLDLLSVRAVFISHTHMDHVGGLANLFWTMRKLDGLAGADDRRLAGRTVQLVLPNLATWEGTRQVLAETEGNFTTRFDIQATRTRDGLIYEHDGLRVTAQHNLHLGEPADGADWLSYSLRIEADGKAVVYSGDVRSPEDVAPILDNADLFLMETGHHHPEDVCRYVRDGGKQIGRLGFIHHGRDILDHLEDEQRKIHDILGDRVFIADDGMQLTV